MLTFSEYLQEMRMLRKIKEDAIVSGEISDNSIVSQNSSNLNSDIVSHSAAPPMSDYSVLGKADVNDSGFMGKNDFFIPKNVLSGSAILKRTKVEKK